MSATIDRLQSKYQKSALSPSEVAAELGVSVKDVLAAANDSTLPARWLGSSVTFPLPSFAAYLDGDLSSPRPSDFFQQGIDKAPDAELSYHTPNGEEDTCMSDVRPYYTGYVGHHKGSEKHFYQITLGKSETGKRMRETKTFPTEDAANKALELRLQELNSAVQPLAPKIKTYNRNTLYRDYLDYMLTSKLSNCSTTTQKGYVYSIGALKAGLGDFPLKELSDTLFTQFFNEYKKKYAQPTINRVYILAKKSTTLAAKEKILDDDILDEFKKPKTDLSATDEEGKDYALDELKIIMSRAEKYPELYPILRVFNCTGMRPGELQALTWDNIVLDGSSPHLRITSAAKKNWDTTTWKATAPTIGPTKTPYSVRTLPLDPKAVAALKDWKQYLKKTHRYRYAANSPYVFPMPDGNFISHDALRLRFDRFLSKEGLNGRGYCLYRFRHTVCSNLFRKKCDPPEVMRFMGDNTTDVIMKIYRQVNREDIENMGAALADMYKEI